MQHIIIGAGPAGVVAAETLRKSDPDAAITIIGDEPEPPYSRMAIPYFLSDNIDESGSYLRDPAEHYSKQNIGLVQQRVEKIDSKAKQVKLADGSTRDYDKLLLATGSRVKCCPSITRFAAGLRRVKLPLKPVNACPCSNTFSPFS